MICCCQNKQAIIIFFSGEGVIRILTCTFYHRAIFTGQKLTLRKNFNINDLFKQSLRAIILLFHYRTGIDMSLDERKPLCRKVWENDYGYLQVDRFAKIGEVRYSTRNCLKTTYIEGTTKTKQFLRW